MKVEDLEKTVSRLNSIALRYLLAFENNRKNSLVVSGFPKSGTTWATQVLSKALNFNYRQNKVRFAFEKVALHTHSINFYGRQNIVYVVRDPREIVCSAFRACSSFRTCSTSEIYLNEFGLKIDKDFCEYVLKHFPGSRASWDVHVTHALQQGWSILFFEDLKSNPIEALGKLENISHQEKLLRANIVSDALHQFSYSSMEAKSSHSNFLNGSNIDSWKTLLTKDAQQYISREFGNVAKSLGKYELW